MPGQELSALYKGNDGADQSEYRGTLRAIQERWPDFRRALQRCDHLRLNQPFTYARKDADASGLWNRWNPLLPAFLRSDLNKEAGVDAPEERFDELDYRLDA